MIGIKDSITFEGETVAQLAEDFHSAINHYLADCKQEGRIPDKPYSGKLTLRIAPSVHAELSGKSLNKWVADTLEQAVHSSSLRC